jgi:hypothetical protein
MGFNRRKMKDQRREAAEKEAATPDQVKAYNFTRFYGCRRSRS